MNILLLGPTGVGKSTFVNSIYNYLCYETLEEAERTGVKVSIPTRFSVFDRWTRSRKDVTVGNNSIGDENLEGRGGSATMNPMSHVFLWDDKAHFRIIDTPGMGDTRGGDQDEANLKGIISSLRGLKYIHGICFVLKPDEPRLTEWLDRCVTALFEKLHKSALNNVVFCFTSTKQTNYDIGDSFEPLTEVVERIKVSTGVDIPLNEDTMYFFENDPFRYLASVRDHPELMARRSQDLETSWTVSRCNCLSMFKHFSELDPHWTADTLMVDEAKMMAEILKDMLVVLQESTDKNIKLIQERVRAVEENSSWIVALEKSSILTKKVVVVRELKFSRLVCASAKCVDTVGNSKVYKTICHDNCSKYSRRSAAEQLAAESAKLGFRQWRCSAINLFGNCKTCRCHHSAHVFLMHETVEDEIKEENPLIMKMLKEKASAKSIAETYLEIGKTEEKELKEERAVLEYAFDQLQRYLKLNSISLLKQNSEDNQMLNVCSSSGPDAPTLSIFRLVEVLCRQKVSGPLVQKAKALIYANFEGLGFNHKVVYHHVPTAPIVGGQGVASSWRRIFAETVRLKSNIVSNMVSGVNQNAF